MVTVAESVKSKSVGDGCCSWRKDWKSNDEEDDDVSNTGGKG